MAPGRTFQNCFDKEDADPTRSDSLNLNMGTLVPAKCINCPDASQVGVHINEEIKIIIMTTLTDMKLKIYQDIKNQLDERILDIDGRLNDTNAKMSIVLSDQREKIDEIDATMKTNEHEANKKINKFKEDLNKLIEENMDDTTKAVVTLRKTIVDEVREEKEERVREQKKIISNIENIVITDKDNITEHESKHIDEDAMPDIVNIKSSLSENGIRIVKNEEATDRSIESLKDTFEKSLENQEKKNNEEFAKARDALYKTIEQTSSDINCLHSKINEETEKLNSAISANEKHIAASADKFNEEILVLKGKIENQEDQQTRTNNIIFTNFETVQSNLEDNVKESECSLKQQIQSTAVSMKDDLESLSEKINTEIVQVNETIEKEKNDIQSFCSTLEGNVQSHIQKNNNEHEMLTVKLSNERKAVEIEMRKEKADIVECKHENTFVNMFNHLSKKIMNLQDRVDTEVEKAYITQNNLEESLISKQEELESSLETSRLLEKEELNDDKARMLESMQESESGFVSKLSDLEVDLLAKQQEAALELVDMKTTLEKQLQSFVSNVRLPLSISFSAYRDTDYGGKGEDYLTFSGCSVNTDDAMDPK